MFRKTIIAAAAAATVAAAAMGGAASSAQAGFHFNLTLPVHGYYGGGYHAPHYRVKCRRKFVGWRKVWTGYGWKHRKIYRKKCRRIYY